MSVSEFVEEYSIENQRLIFDAKLLELEQTSVEELQQSYNEIQRKMKMLETNGQSIIECKEIIEQLKGFAQIINKIILKRGKV
jgi:virulence-associated protein VapD